MATPRTATPEEVIGPCPFSVETIADRIEEGSVGNVHLAIAESSSMLSETVPEGEEGPDLVRVESSEDSASSSSNCSKQKANPKQQKGKMSQKSSQSGALVSHNHDDVGMIDCLSDQFANMFCPAGVQQVCVSKNESVAKEQSCNLPCNVFNNADPSTDVFSHLQFWWSPSLEEKNQPKRTPKNRSIRHKSKHIRSLMDNWHPTPAEPMMRSQSILDGCVGTSATTTTFPRNSPPPDGFYDSDPEVDFKRQQRRESLQVKQTPRSYKENKPEDIDTMSACSYDEGDHRRPSAPKNALRRSFHFGSRDSSPTSVPEFDLLNPASDEYIRQFVQEVTNTKLNLIWHRYTEPEESSGMDGVRAPLAVGATFEVGTHLDQKVVQPKLSWTAVNKNKDQKKKSQVDSDWVELLSIIRVFTPQSLNRKMYPFARTDRTICIVANDDRNPYLVFEAESTSQRDWLVTALKMTVARLASIIIVKDEKMLMEFFSPYAAIMNLKESEERERDEDGPVCENEGPESEEDETGSDMMDENVDVDANGELNLINLSPVIFNPKDL
eukprot:scaffold1870_cov104-Cylindrotheca_fusiformis.AAC.6